MNPRADYLIEILEKIGSPLMRAIIAVRGDASSGAPEQDAQTMATLLAKTVQVSIDMANATDLSKAGTADDSVRVALAALASLMVAQQYRQNGKIPADQNLKKITTALQAVMSFSDNFAPSEDNTGRLKDLAAKGKPVDAHQVNLQYIHAFIPVVNAIGNFSFGQSEQKLIMDVSSKLVAKAASLGRNILGDMPEEEQKLVEVALLRSLAEIYAQCHETETQRLTAMSDEERAAQPQASGGGLALDPVWAAFDLRIAMLEAMAENTLPAGKGSSGKKPSAPPPAAPTTEAIPPAPKKDVPPPPAAPPSAPLEAPEPEETAKQTPPPADKLPAQNGGNPMSMFAKPKDGDSAATPPPSETPPAAEPPAQPPNDSAADTPKDKPAGSPMSFFKPQSKSDDEN